MVGGGGLEKFLTRYNYIMKLHETAEEQQQKQQRSNRTLTKAFTKLKQPEL